MKLTDEQRQFVNWSENGLLVACPGSGKTRVILAKLLWCLNEIQDTSRAVACITYTNAAVHEIENRLLREGGPSHEQQVEISTIHSFCLNNVLRHFAWMSSEYPSGFSVLSPDSEQYNEVVNEILAEYGLSNQAREAFPMLNRLPDGTPIVSGPISSEIALDFWERLQHANCIDFPNIVYISYKLLADKPFLARGIASRFAWILVDEFQDTSSLQIEILTLIASHNRTRFALVGDTNQSIYGFAGARPELMFQFAKTITARQDFQLTGNYRSSPSIIAHAEKLCPRTPPMKSVGGSSNFKEDPLHIHGETAFQLSPITFFLH